MNRTITARLAAKGLLRSAASRGTAWSSVPVQKRPIEMAPRSRLYSSQPPARTAPPEITHESRDTAGNVDNLGTSSMQRLTGLIHSQASKVRGIVQIDDDVLDAEDGSPGDEPRAEQAPTEPYHFHVFSHKHNTHVTVTRPNREPIVSMSCGNLGFKKSQRKHYDAAYQLGAYVIDKLQQAGWYRKIHALEVVLRGFGPGRDAVTKVLLGNEGRMLRPKIERVADSTRLKFGGTRSRKPRRLG